MLKLLKLSLLCWILVCILPQTIPAAKSFDYDQIKAKFTNDEELTQAESLYWEQFQGDFQSGNAPSRPPRDDEGGPDDFGYTWKDSEEDGGPEYEWIDITEDGDRLNPSDDWNSGPLELGFEFTWYDRETDVIRVCSNGWITFDENDNNRTYPLPRCPTANAPNAVVSVNGYDLNPTQGGGQMWYWTNEEDMAIVSWINVPRWANNNIVQTMQVIIHGNGVVILQYGELRNLNYGGDCNVGFESWNGQDGLSIGYHQNNMPSEDYAIRIGARMGWVEGVVTDLETEDAIAEVEVLLSDGSVTNTDEDGFFILSDISEEEGYTITASKPGFNTVVSEEFEVLDAETTVVEMALPHPEIRANVEAFEKELAQRAIENDEFQIINEGNGDLEFEMKYSVPVRRDDPGDIIFEFNASEITGDSRLKGVTTDGSNLYFTGANNGENPNKVYVVTLEGELERDFDQPVEDPSSNGMKGVVFDGTYLYAADGQEIVKFTTDGEAIDAIEGPFNPTQYLAYDPESDHFWVCSTSSSIVEIDREGNVITELDSDVRKYGITWHPNDLEGYNIYLSVRVRDGSNCVIMKVHPESGEVRFVMDITNGEDDKLSDCHLTNAFNPLVWAFIVIVEVGIPDFVRTHELSLNTSWVEVDPMEGTVEPESELDIEVTFDAGNWVPGTYELLLLIESNAAGDPINIPLTLDVSDEGLEMQFYEFLETERRHSFVIQSVILRGEAAIFGDEIGVFTPDGLCVGGSIWFEQVTTIRAYGDDPDTDFTEGFVEGEAFAFRIWDSEADRDFAADFEMTGGDERFAVDGTTRGSIEVPGQIRELNFDLALGWHLISANLELDEDDVRVLFADLVENESLGLLKDGIGRFYNPEYNYNSIPNWESTEGYLIKLLERDNFTFRGAALDPATGIDLPEGWSMIAYLPRWEMDARVAFAPLENNLIIVKDGRGRFYNPEYDYSNMGDLSEQNGYQIKVNEAVEFRYPQAGRMVNDTSNETENLEHFRLPQPTDNNMSLLMILPEGYDDSEVAVVNQSGAVFGAGKVSGEHLGIAVWGDDPTTSDLDGLNAEENYLLLIWDRQHGERSLEFTVLTGNDKYLSNGFTALQIENPDALTPTEVTLYGAYPNPFNQSTAISFGLPAQAQVKLDLFDLRGRLVENLVTASFSTGNHNVMFEGNSITSGTYLLRLRANEKSHITKLVLLR